MSRPYQTLLHRIEGLGAWILLLVALLFTVDILARYVWGTTYSWIVELEWYGSAAAICLAFAPTLFRDGHVRVDLIRTQLSPSTNRWIDRVGHTLLLLPWCVFGIYASTRYAYGSFLVNEASPDPGGLPLRYVIKAFLVLAFFLLAVEGLRQLYASRVHD